MKIGIMTVHDASNFGAYLQAYAMKYTLEEMGHDVFFIRTRSIKECRQEYYKLPATRRSLTHPIEEFQKYLFGRKKWKAFCEARRKMQESEFEKIHDFDRIIIGSDEMWNVKEPVFRNPLFFGKGMSEAMTYGISVGRADIEDFQEKNNIKEAIRQLKWISVRDEKTADIVEEITGKRPVTVCDPTFLAPISKLQEPFSNEYLTENPFLLVYTYPFILSESMVENIVAFARERGLKVVAAGFFFGWCDYCVNCRPLQFPSIIEKAKYVVTTTFHGAIFSFRKRADFIVIPFSQKVLDVLQRVGITDRAVDMDCSYEQFTKTLDRAKTDFDHVDQLVDIYAMRSRQMLENAINSQL